ncbi:hypothetical protein ZOSMA_5G02210 [Zostera marina]|uniref:Uncharacterized protein n=1 Tax=Zostera marina TaxID=29655 RepID=A0A0K9NU91_ZOSMR|nr:hypothetical protein ZOSMA_5G02210 [Zostera marina]
MECCGSSASSSLRLYEALPVKLRFRDSPASRPHSFSVHFQAIDAFSGDSGQVWSSRGGTRRRRRRCCLVVKSASAEFNKCEFRDTGSPLRPLSEAGKFLAGIMENTPHILNVAATELLKELAFDREAAVGRQRLNNSSSESVLHKRIAEMKKEEYRKVVEEVMYTLVVRGFSKIRVLLIPNLSELTTSEGGKIEFDEELESIHSPEKLDLVREHLSNILRRDETTTTQNRKTFSRLQLGRLYASSIMYGYFLEAASARHRLEERVYESDHKKDQPLGTICVPHLDRQFGNVVEDLDLAVHGNPFDAVSIFSPGLIRSKKPNRRDLKAFVKNMDPKSVQLCARLRSPVAASIIENQSLAVFGDGIDLGVRDDLVSLTFSGLKRLVLEAVAFGTFLWKEERLVDSIYRLPDELSSPSS